MKDGGDLAAGGVGGLAQSEREALFAEHIDFARRIAARHFGRGAHEIELDDLFQLAATGLLEAIDRYDPTRNVPFRPYAARRITGAVLSGVAKMSEVREQIAFRNRVRAERIRSLAPDAADHAASLEAVIQLADIAVGLALGFMMELGGIVATPQTPDRRASAYESLAWKELLRRLSLEVESLPDREQLIVRQHYFQGVDFSRIATLMGVSRGRVSQIHRAAIARLAQRMSKSTAFVLKR